MRKDTYPLSPHYLLASNLYLFLSESLNLFVFVSLSKGIKALSLFLLCKCQGNAWLVLNKAKVKLGKVVLPPLYSAKSAMCIICY